MSASPLMSLGMKAMAASYAGLQTTGHNIANANVEGFSRQQVALTTPEGQFTGAGFPVYRGKGAKLQRALIQFFLDENIKAGYEEILPPHLVNHRSQLLRHGHGKLQILGVQGFVRIGAIEVNDA